MDLDRIRKAAEQLERAVQAAREQGFENADCVLTSEVLALLPKAKAGELTAAVQLKFTAGPRWNFTETRLGDCGELEDAWCEFRMAVEDRDSDPAFRAYNALLNGERPP
ncbi:hypothetical protein ACXU4B_10790 [Dyella soli]|uniref:Uncharacterized protein n=1 Tax=Dyella soli TaxID=522319 RepID=A0A4R0YGG4_9GAMM|nr:hypothetical protein [Dyella soli]TCI07336.1 hypothetical protein EZM97_32630 [Dyella soli]